MTDHTQRPSSIHHEPGLGPRGPWSFLKEAARGGFNDSGRWLIAGWLILAILPAFLWASYLMSHTQMGGGWSALPAHWGEQLNAKDVVELFDRGEIHGGVGFGASTALICGLSLVLWSSWKHQAAAAGLRHKLGPWIGGALDTLLAGLPVLIVFLIVSAILGYLGGLGIPGLSWLAFLGRPVLALATSSTLMIQWWLLRLNRLERKGQGWFAHVWLGFRRLWSHPVQWFLLAAGLSVLRLLLHVATLDLAWRLGGGSVPRVGVFVLLEAVAAFIGAWLLGWTLRTVALFWRHDQAVRRAIAELEAAATATTGDSAGDAFDA